MTFTWPIPKSLIASSDGSRLYVGVGSNSNAGENGLDNEERRACILEIDGEPRCLGPQVTAAKERAGLCERRDLILSPRSVRPGG
jgi:hypothetical protein